MTRDGAGRAGRTLGLALVVAGAMYGHAAAATPDVPPRDFAAELLGLPTPTQQAPDRLGDTAPMPAALAQTRVELARAFFAGDFATVDRTLAAAHAQYAQGASPRDESERLPLLIVDAGLAGAERCEQWMKAMPRSYAAFRLCGKLWQRGAWMARTEQAADKITDTQFALMRDRARRSSRLLQQALTLDARPVQALAMLADNQFLLRQKVEAQATLERVMAMMPRHADAYEVAARYARPEWGGTPQAVAAVVQRAKRADVDADRIAYIEDHSVVRPWVTPTPGAEKLYWEKVIAERATYQRLEDFAMYHARLSNWRDALPVLDRSIREHPHVAASYYWRARSREELGDGRAALPDYRLAAAMGSEPAIQRMIQAHIQGALGLPARNLAALLELCRYAAALGSPAGANCLGSSLWDGSLPGLPKDAAQALAWHAFGARGGSANSQHDLGWLLMSQRGPAGLDAATAKAAGIFWLQRAAEQQHGFAIRKLQEAGIAVERPAAR